MNEVCIGLALVGKGVSPMEMRVCVCACVAMRWTEEAAAAG